MGKLGILIVSLALLLVGVFYLNYSSKIVEEEGVESSIAATPPEPFSTWHPFVPQSKLFTVMLPHSPQYAKDQVAIAGSHQMRRFDMYASEKIDGSLFLINVITYPPDVDTSDADGMLKQTIEELMKHKPDNRLNKLEKSLFKNHHSIDFDLTSQEFQVQGKILMVDKVIYVLSYITRLNEFDADEYHYFINSFKLLGRQEDKS